MQGVQVLFLVGGTKTPYASRQSQEKKKSNLSLNVWKDQVWIFVEPSLSVI